MNRKQFAEVVAQAYVNQYHWQEWRRDPVMNDPIVYYDVEREMFASLSSLAPLTDAEVLVLTLCDGMFGDGRVTKRDIRDFLLNNVSDAIWFDVIEQIEAFQQEIDMLCRMPFGLT